MKTNHSKSVLKSAGRPAARSAARPATQLVCPSAPLAMLLLALAAVYHPYARADAAADADAAAQVAGQVCSNCHGPAGVSISPMFPRLAGQQELYLAAQIRAFKSKTRADPEAHNYMWGMATLVSEPMVDALAHYYSTQTPGPGIAGDEKLIAQGKRLFEQGVPERGIAACASCHGADAQGRSIFPRLAGQHAAYLVRQLDVIQQQLRTSTIMHGIVKDLKPDEMKAVATYLQSR
ncbi:MAG: cytochrome c4 [Nevskia sp.]|nr:cytochrome c4 [Nevskia sp.]